MSVHVISWVLEHSEARLADRLVLIVLADHASKNGDDSYPTVETIAREARVSEASVHRSIGKLLATGAIVQTGRRPDARADRAANCYRVVMTGSQNDTPSTGSQNDTPPSGTGSQIASDGVSSCTPTGSQIETQTVLIEPSLEPSKDRDTSELFVLDPQPPPIAVIFDEFWHAYPRKSGKKEAARKFEIAARTTAPAVIIAGARRYAADPQRQAEYTKLPATWLHQGCWDDDPIPAPASTTDRRVNGWLALETTDGSGLTPRSEITR